MWALRTSTSLRLLLFIIDDDKNDDNDDDGYGYGYGNEFTIVDESLLTGRNNNGVGSSLAFLLLCIQ